MSTPHRPHDPHRPPDRRLSVIPFREINDHGRVVDCHLSISDLVALTRILRETINPGDQAPEALVEVSLTPRVHINLASGFVTLQLSLVMRDGTIDSYNYTCTL